MDAKSKLILGTIQINNLLLLTKDGPYAGFITSHLLPVKFELERQLSLLTNVTEQTKIKE